VAHLTSLAVRITFCRMERGAIPNKLFGVAALMGAVVVIFSRPT
jgi:hypothetical protein